MQRLPMRSIAAAGVAAALLSGCATGYLMDNEVQSFSALPSQPAQLSYTFERLPSQAAAQPTQAQIEALADPALFKAGFRRDDAAPRYRVQVTARIQRTVSPWPEPWEAGWGPGFAYGHPRLGFGYGWGGFPRMDQAWFQREVGIVVREAATHKVVYETRASSDGPWLDPNAALPAMFDAALQGFPNPPAGPRRVDVHLGGKPQATAAAPATVAPAAGTPAAPASATR